MQGFRNLRNPLWTIRYLSESRNTELRDLKADPSPLIRFASGLGIKAGFVEGRGLWWDGGARKLSAAVFLNDPEDAAFYIGCILFTRKQDQSWLYRDNLGLTRLNGLNSKNSKDLADFGAIAGAVIIKALTGSAADYLDEWGMDFHRVPAKESQTRERVREIAEQLIYLDVMEDIEKGLRRYGFDL